MLLRAVALVVLTLLVAVQTPPGQAQAQTACASQVGPGIPPPTELPAKQPGFHAAWYGQSGYMSLCPGARASAVVAYANTGSLGWVAGRMGQAAYLGTWGPEPGQDRPSTLGGDGTHGSPATGWPRYDRIADQPHPYVGPGQTAWFTFTVQAPAVPGVYRLYLRPLIEGATWMEDAGVFWVVTVLNPDGSPPSSLPPLPTRWPRTFEVGLTSQPGTASGIRAKAPLGFRYQYLAGGVNTGSGWAHWNSDGSFVTRYIEESRAAGTTSFFSYYQLLQSAPGNALAEPESVYANLADAAVMRALFDDLELFFTRAAAFTDTHVVLQVEPDLWGYIQQRWGDDASRAPVPVASSGHARTQRLPDTAAGLAQAVVRMRDTLAPNVSLAYPVSVWGTGTDIVVQDIAADESARLGARAAAFYLSLGARFDIATGEYSDRDAAFYEHVRGTRERWWSEADHESHLAFVARFAQNARLRVVQWQIPLGNTRMRAMDNSWGHYQDTHVQRLLETAAWRERLVQAGVVALLFGGGASGTTCACDAMGDGVTDPPPIADNVRPSLSADDDGGFFFEQAARFYVAGGRALP